MTPECAKMKTYEVLSLYSSVRQHALKPQLSYCTLTAVRRSDVLGLSSDRLITRRPTAALCCICLTCSEHHVTARPPYPSVRRQIRSSASRALHNLVRSQPDGRRARREARVLRLLEQLREYTEGLWQLSDERAQPGLPDGENYNTRRRR